MIPYLQVPALSLEGVTLDAQALLSGAGLLFAILLSRRRARRAGVDLGRLNSFTLWLLVGALIGGHIAHVLGYHLDEFAQFYDGHVFWKRPWQLMQVWDGWRSVGGFFGALFAAMLWRTHRFEMTDWLRFSEISKLEGYWFVRRPRAEPIPPLSDMALSVFPAAWAFNRAGAALVHDRPGTRAPAESLLAVAYPASALPRSVGFGVLHGAVPRYDLGLLELLLLLVLVVVFAALWKRRLKAGSYVCLAGVTYPPARFALDFLSRRTGAAANPRFAALTPTQWGFAILFLLSVAMLLRLSMRPLDGPLEV